MSEKITNEQPISKLVVEPSKIFRVCPDEIHQKKLALVYEGLDPKKTILKGVCLIHIGNEVYLWIGANSSSEAKRIGLYAVKLLLLDLKSKYPFTTYHIAHEKRETTLFRSKFIDYEGCLPISMRVDEIAGNIAADVEQIEIDVDALLLIPPDIEPETFGLWKSLKVYKVHQFLKLMHIDDREEIPASFHGIFSRLDSYILVFVYRPPNAGKDKCVCYFWQGSKSPITEKGTSGSIMINFSVYDG
jgi:hypothetical protein